jgi:hypothetical protein
MQKALKMHSADNVAMVLQATPAQTVVTLMNRGKEEFLLKKEIDSYHKFALSSIDVGKEIIKYGEVIGIATVAIAQGEHVHTHNCKEH